MFSHAARPAELGRVLINESVAQQPPTLMTVGGTWFPGNPEPHPHDRQLTGLLAIEWVPILAQSVVWTRWQRAEHRKVRDCHSLPWLAVTHAELDRTPHR